MKFLTLCIFLLLGCAPSIRQFQQDADIVKHKHLRYYAEILYEYNIRVGHYPFARKGSPARNYVYIANVAQKKHIKEPGFAINRITPKEFFEEIEAKLQKPIKEYYDPQYEHLDKPNYYIYVATDTNFYFSVHVSKDYPYSAKTLDGFHKIELSNDQNAASRVFPIKTLMKDRTFLHESERITSRVRFFKDRDRKYIRHSRK